MFTHVYIPKARKKLFDSKNMVELVHPTKAAVEEEEYGKRAPYQGGHVWPWLCSLHQSCRQQLAGMDVLSAKYLSLNALFYACVKGNGREKRRFKTFLLFNHRITAILCFISTNYVEF